MSKKNKTQPPTAWREIGWPEYVVWLQGKTIVPNPPHIFADSGEELLTFSDGSQAKMISIYNAGGCETCSPQYEPPKVEVREKHE